MVTLKILIIIAVALGLLAISKRFLLLVWIVTSPFVTNFITRPDISPLFGSTRIVVASGARKIVEGFEIRELFSYDRLVLLLLFFLIQSQGSRKQFKDGGIGIVFIWLVGSGFVGSIFSENIAHGLRYAFDTFGLSFIAYHLGKQLLAEEKGFSQFINALVVFGCVLVGVSMMEYHLYGDYLYRITGPFLYWENLGLMLAIILFVVMYKLRTDEVSLMGKLGLNALIGLIAVCIFLTGTRTIMFVILAGILFMNIKGGAVLARKTVRRQYIFLASTIIIVLASPVLLKQTSFYQHRLSKRTDEGRIENYYAAGRMFARSPIYGIGLKNFMRQQVNYATEEELEEWHITERGSCHNSYLVAAAETGVMGLIPMILIVILSFGFCTKYFDLAVERKEKMWALTLGAITVVYFLSALTFDPFYEVTIDNKIYYICLGLSVGRYGDLLWKSSII